VTALHTYAILGFVEGTKSPENRGDQNSYFDKQEYVVIFSFFYSRRTAWLIGFVLIVVLSGCNSLVGATSTPTPTRTPVPLPSPGTPYSDLKGTRPFIDTFNNIHLLANFDYNIDNPEAIAKYYDFFWGASLDDVRALRTGNPNIFLTYYIPFHREAGTFTNPNATHALSYWKAFHPDWILYKCDRVTPAYEFGDPNVPLDFSNPALVAWQIQTYALPASENGYDGIAADNVSLQNYFGACGIYVNGQWKQLYSGQVDDPQWRADILTWLSHMQTALHRLAHPLALIPNLSIGNIPPTNPIVQQVVAHIDGIVDEDGFTEDSRGDLSDAAWTQLVQFMVSVQQAHKPFYVVNQFASSSVSQQEIQWALASYLMGKGHNAAIFISTYQGYGGDTRYPEYNAQVGSPVGAMYAAQHVYWRTYSAGLSIANPSATQTYTVTLNATHSYVDLYGYIVQKQVTLPPHSGLVLLLRS
jgi:hypothetical protein